MVARWRLVVAWPRPGVVGRPRPGADSQHGSRNLVLNCLTIQTCLNSVQVLNNSDNLVSCQTIQNNLTTYKKSRSCLNSLTISGVKVKLSENSCNFRYYIAIV